MKLFIRDRHISIDIDADLFSSLEDWMPFLNDLLEPITDRKHQLAFDATHRVDTFEDYAVFQRYFLAGQLVLGAILTTAERAFAIAKKDSATTELPSEKILKSEEFQSFLKNEFERFYPSKIEVKHITKLENAKTELLDMAKRFSEIIFNDGLVKNVTSVLNSETSLLSKVDMALESLLQRKKEDQFIKLNIESTQQSVLIYFNGSQEQFQLLDKWLDAEDLVLPQHGTNALSIETPVKFVDWYNRLRMRLENECSYQTLMSFIALFDVEKQDHYRSNVDGEIKRVCEAVNLTDHEKRGQVVAFCNNILNKRNNVDPKQHKDISLSMFLSSFDEQKQIYLLNLYE